MAQDIERERFPGYRLAGPLGGRYQITALIAAGGMAEVFDAHDSVLDRRVAVKILHATYGADAEFVERFRREAMAAGRLNHPNIVQVYDWGRNDDGAAYMVMERVVGKNLREVLRERDGGRITPPAAARLIEQVCRALDAARREGIVHRDVKPENILVTSDGRAKVADFGVARALAESRATQAGVVLGTASYLAPEQVEGKPGDHRSDIYALGTVLYEILTGEAPFRGDNPVVVAYRRVAEDVPALRTVLPGAPAALEQIVARATARDPDQRYQTAAEMAAALAPLAGDARDLLFDTIDDDDASHTRAIPVSTAETTVIRRRVKPKRLRRRLVALAILLLAAGMIPVGVRVFGTVPVPNVTGLTQEAATASIEQAGFQAESVVRNHPTIAQGHVISITPAEGSKLRRGSKVTMAVSLGPLLVPVPDLRGKTLAQATKALTDLGLTPVVSNRFTSSVKKGLVFDQNPDPNVNVRSDAKVTVIVSAGPEMVAVADVTGKPEADARETLRDQGFTVTSRRVIDEKLPAGQVIRTEPPAATEVEKGSAVTMVVSDGPEQVPVPDVRGETWKDAQAILVRAGFKPNRKQVPGSSGDVVVSQVPGPGKKAKRGSTVIVYTA